MRRGPLRCRVDKHGRFRGNNILIIHIIHVPVSSAACDRFQAAPLGDGGPMGFIEVKAAFEAMRSNETLDYLGLLGRSQPSELPEGSAQHGGRKPLGAAHLNEFLPSPAHNVSATENKKCLPLDPLAQIAEFRRLGCSYAFERFPWSC